MPNETNDLPPPVSHIFVDFENIHEIDLAVIGNKTVHFTLLLGSRQTKLDVALVEKLLHHAATVELVRLTSAGKNALDFTLSYYVGRAAVADPTGYFHIVSKDAGFDPLIEHLRSKRIRAHRHEDFTRLTLSAATKPLGSAPVPAAPAVKAPPKPKAQPSHLEALEARALQHLRKRATYRPGNKKRLVSDLVTHLGNKITEAEALQLVEFLGEAGHLVINEKDMITSHLGQE